MYQSEWKSSLLWKSFPQWGGRWREAAVLGEVLCHQVVLSHKGQRGADRNARWINSRDVEKLCKICLMSLYPEQLDTSLLFLLLQKSITMSLVQNSLGKLFLLSSCVGWGISQWVTHASISGVPSTVCIVYFSGDTTETCKLQQPRWWEGVYSTGISCLAAQSLFRRAAEVAVRGFFRYLSEFPPPCSGGGY